MASCLSDPLIHYGKHFGRTRHALCSIRTLLKNGRLRLERVSNGDPGLTFRGRFGSTPIPSLSFDGSTFREEKEHHVFQSLLQMIPGLEARLLESSEEELRLIADLVRNLHYIGDRCSHADLPTRRFKRVSPVLDPTILRA